MPQEFRGGKTGKVPSAEKIPLSGSFSAKSGLRAEQKNPTKRISFQKFPREQGLGRPGKTWRQLQDAFPSPCVPPTKLSKRESP
jgi:hypothetical protein